MHTPREELEKVVEVVREITDPKRPVLQRHPLVFALLGTFGLVATFYGFEHLIDQIDFLNRNPYILLLVGIATLIITGTLYKKLGD